MVDVYKTFEDYNPNEKCKIRGRKLNISLVFITQLYLALPKDIRLISTHYFIMKFPNKREL